MTRRGVVEGDNYIHIRMHALDQGSNLFQSGDEIIVAVPTVSALSRFEKLMRLEVDAVDFPTKKSMTVAAEP